MTRPLIIGPDRRGIVVVVENDRITSVSRDDATVVENAEHLSADEHDIVPGSVNAHTHLYSGLCILGMPEPDEEPQSFREILERVWWRLDRALDPKSIRAAARLYVADALLFGTTSLIDHHESPSCIAGSLDVLADACQEIGMRAVLTYGATDRNGGDVEGAAGLAECRRFIESNERPLVRGCVGLHASFTCSDETVRAAGEMARELRVPIHTHVAESADDIDHAQSIGHVGPLERLSALGALPAGSILAHGVRLTESQIDGVEESGAWLVQNPRSNTKNNVGYPQLFGASRRVALGTDGFSADMAIEEEALFEAGVEFGEVGANMALRADRGRLIIAQRFDASLDLAVGGLADLVVRSGRTIQHVVVGGRVVVRNGALIGVDPDRIGEEAAEEAEALRERIQSIED